MSRGEKTAAICLAAGRGKRMESRVQKQYLLLGNKPVLYYSLAAFENSSVDEVILVTGAGEEEYCQKEIIEAYGFTKVRAVVAGGKERYHSVYRGLLAAEEGLDARLRRGGSSVPDYVLIHDGARPFLNNEIIQRCMDGARTYGACVAGMPAKDTVKLADAGQNIETTPDRSRVWMVQTPQAFRFSLIKEAYDKLTALEAAGEKTEIPITDDAMAVEYFLGEKVHLVQGSYENIKITTPEDMKVAAALLSGRIRE